MSTADNNGLEKELAIETSMSTASLDRIHTSLTFLPNEILNLIIHQLILSEATITKRYTETIDSPLSDNHKKSNTDILLIQKQVSNLRALMNTCTLFRQILFGLLYQNVILSDIYWPIARIKTRYSKMYPELMWVMEYTANC